MGEEIAVYPLDKDLLLVDGVAPAAAVVAAADARPVARHQIACFLFFRRSRSPRRQMGEGEGNTYRAGHVSLVSLETEMTNFGFHVHE